MSCELTIDRAREVLQIHGGVLKSGKHTQTENCDLCVRELRAIACEIEYSDHPDGHTASATDRACQLLNDAAWPGDADRTRCCLPLALLSEETAPAKWAERYAELTIRYVVPMALRSAASVHPDQSHKDEMELIAVTCEQNGTKDAARAAYAAADAAADAAYATNAARAAYAAANAAADAAYATNAADAADAAADAAAYAANAAEILQSLIMGVTVLLMAHNREDLIDWPNPCLPTHNKHA